jgi:hypothetical protein
VSGFHLRARLDFSIPSCSPGQRGITPAFGYSAPHLSAEGTSTPMTHALPSAHYEPLRHPKAPSLALAGFPLIIADHAMGLPVLRTLSLCTCCRHYPGVAPGRILRSAHPAVPAFPKRVVGSACALSFSRIAQRSLALRPAHSRCHLFVTLGPLPIALPSTGAVARRYQRCRGHAVPAPPMRRPLPAKSDSQSRAVVPISEPSASNR